MASIINMSLVLAVSDSQSPALSLGWDQNPGWFVTMWAYESSWLGIPFWTSQSLAAVAKDTVFFLRIRRKSEKQVTQHRTFESELKHICIIRVYIYIYHIRCAHIEIYYTHQSDTPSNPMCSLLLQIASTEAWHLDISSIQSLKRVKFPGHFGELLGCRMDWMGHTGDIREKPG